MMFALVVTAAANAQSTFTLDTFNSGSATGSVVTSPIPSTWSGNVTQNSGSITIGGNARDDNGWSASGLSVDASGMAYVRISGQRDSGNAAPTFTVQFLDTQLNSVFFSVNTAAFALGAPSQVQIPITGWDAGFNSAQIVSWNIGGGTTGLVAFRMTLDNLALSSALIPISTGGTITTAGNQVYSGAVALGAATVLGSVGSNGNAITFNSTIDGAQALTLNTPGAMTLAGAVGESTPLASLTTSGGGNTVVSGGKVITSGAQSYAGSVSLGADTVFKSGNAGISLSGAVSGNGKALVIDTAQAASLVSASNLASLTKSGNGTLTLTGHSTYTGGTIINAGTLALGVSDALAGTSALTLAGGTLASNGFSQTFGTLTLAGGSTIDFGNGASALAFADSSAIGWNGTLTILNYTTSMDSLRFGTSNTGLTSTQLGLISFGSGFFAQIDGNGFVTGVSAIPEPSTSAALAGSGVLGLAVWRRRRKRHSVGKEIQPRLT